MRNRRHPSSQLRLVAVGEWRRKRRGVRVGVIVLLTAAIVASGVFVASASHNFSDVPTGIFYHNAVEWVKNRGITAGCAVGLYCPNDPVTRGTMAVFLRALGVALTPQVIRGTSSGSPVDPDAVPFVCLGTGPFGAMAEYSPPFPQRILARGWVSMLAGTGAMNTFIRLMYSTDAGGSWFAMDADNTHWPSVGASASFWYQTTSFAYLDLSPGTTYRFGVQVGRAGPFPGTADAPDHLCEFIGEIVNRNPGTSPLMPTSQQTSR